MDYKLRPPHKQRYIISYYCICDQFCYTFTVCYDKYTLISHALEKQQLTRFGPGMH